MLLLALLFLALLITASHAHALRSAQAMTGAPREERLRLWQKHNWWNGTLWVLLFSAIVIAEFFFPHGQIAPRPYIGTALLIAGFGLTVWARIILGGRSAAMGIRWFLPEDSPSWQKRGLYRILANPMYNGFILIFLGLGLWFGTVENFYLAVASFLLLNLYLARVESRGQAYHAV